MTWFRVDDDLPFHRKVVAAGNAAMGLWVRGGAWCAQHLTDGFIPDEMIAILGTAPQRAKLIKTGLWVEVPGGCLFHQWTENGRQPTAESVREKRARAAERQAKHRTSMYENTQVKASSNGVTDASVTEGVTPFVTGAPTRPDPTTSPSGDVGPTPPASAAQAAPGAQLAMIHGGANEPPTATTAPPETTARTLVAEWIDGCRKRPPGTVVGQTSRAIKAMLDEGVDPADIRTGITAWSAKGLHPSALAAVVNEAMNASLPNRHLAVRAQQGTASKRAQAFLDLRKGTSA